MAFVVPPRRPGYRSALVNLMRPRRSPPPPGAFRPPALDFGEDILGPGAAGYYLPENPRAIIERPGIWPPRPAPPAGLAELLVRLFAGGER